MDMEFSWKHSCGDATDNYDVCTTEPCTVGQLIECILYRSKQYRERGSIWLYPGNVYLCSYKDRVISKPLWWIENYNQSILTEYQGANVVKISANGGYGAMDYSIKYEFDWRLK